MLQTLTINGWPYEYVESGDTTAPPLILIHGWAQDHRLFSLLEPHLKDHFRVIRVNFRGHDADLTDNGDFTADEVVDDFIKLTEALGLQDVRIASTSHGCWVNMGIQERLGEAGFGKAVVIDWLMQPFPGFNKQIHEGTKPETVRAARQSLFDEWTSGSDCLPVHDHVKREMTWFGEEMWMRACREIEKSYTQWGNPLNRMLELSHHLEVAHIYSQPLSADYRVFQEEFAAEHPWFHPIHIPGNTHFPTLESPEAVSSAILAFLS